MKEVKNQTLTQMPFFEKFRNEIEGKMEHQKGRNWYIDCATTKYDNTTHAADLHCEVKEVK